MRSTDSTAKRIQALRKRICRFEEIEPREFLSATPYEAPAPINVGIVYHEDYYTGFQSGQEDAGGDTFVIAWNGGAGNTTLDKIVIDLNKVSGAGSDAKISFNPDGAVRPNGYGTFYPFDYNLESNADNGITANATLSLDGKQLVIDFTGFTAGKKFYFKIDADEYHAGEGTGIDRSVSGKEMEGAMVTSYFSAADYKDNSHKGMFLDQYRFGENTGLDQLLPGDEYYGTGKSDTVNTAGAWGTLDVQDPKAGSISGYVYEDFNNDGQFSSNENPIRNVLLNLYYKNTAGEYEWLSQTQSNANGYYEFTDIPGGRTYLVSETQPAGYADGKDTPGTSGGTSWEPDRISEIHIGANEHGTQYNFGEVKYASLTGYVYHDRNLDGSRGTGEEGITGVAVKVQVKNGDVYQDVEGQTARTDTDGKYRFDNLLPFQTYRIVEAEQPNGFTDGKESVGWIGTESNRTGQLPAADNDTIEAVFLGYDEHGQEYNFGEYKKGSISGYVYEDDNNDGVKDPGEKGIGGVEVWLCVMNEIGEKVNVKKTLTGQDGSYYFDDLEPGQTYCVTEFDPDGYCDGKDTVGTINGTERGSINLEIPEGKDQIHDIYIGSDDNGINYNFAENLRGKISGYVYADADENGKKDTGEAGIGGVLVSLWVWDGEKYIQTSKSATTDGNGYYEFAGLCPFKKYQVRETQPADYNDGQETIGTLGGENSVNDIIGNIEMPPSGNGVNYNFGELVPPPLPPEPGSISGYVYLDADENGVKDSGETGIPGVVLTLQKLVDGQYVDTGRTAATNADGYYSFDDLTPNETYRVVETQPDGYDDGEETVGTLGGDKSANDIISAISVGEGQHGENYNFGELTPPPPPPVPGSISGYVYVDADENGVKDSGETGISGVVLTLQKLVGGQYIDAGRTAATDANGYYIFDDLTPNETYRVVETQPEDYDDGEETVGTLGGDKSANDIISAIPVGENEHGTDYNFGEWIKPVEPPPPYVPPPAPPVPAPPRMSGASGQPPAAAAPSWSAPYIGESLLAGYGGGGLPSGYSWHLSVVNAGYPRDADAGLADAGDIASKSRQTVQYNATTAGDTAHYVSVAWTPMPMNQSVWYVRDKSGRITRKAKFGPDGGIPLVGDFNGDGIADLAVFHNGNWYIDVNGNGEWDEEDLWCELGSSSDQPVVGDWDGDGKTDIAVFGPQWAGDAEVIEQEPGLPSVLNTAQTERSKNMRPNISVHNG
ncbi:MAG: FG-GAP-like repeat-containing protein, partial [Planctomycetaceae bacterium]|nr:FG-GAP-like repeat-containing protein [Planctomycetaceae bacterium]